MRSLSTPLNIQLLTLALLLTALPAAAEERRALLIGISDYTASTLRPPTVEAGAKASTTTGRTAWPDLYGAVNDARAIREMLIWRYGFPANRIELLTDQDATRAAILQAIARHLVAPAGKGDHVVFYFAGHGSQLPNPDSDEKDGLDETLVPADSRWGAADIRDKELRQLFNKILAKGAHLTVILDSCYSGSGARGLPRWRRARGLKADPLQEVSPAAPDFGPRPEEQGALVFSASQDHEPAWETTDEEFQDRGAFSLALLRAMRDSGPRESAEHVFQRAKARLWAEETPQQPVLAGGDRMRHAPLFGGRSDHRGQQTVVAVREVSGDGTVYLEGGWANGLTVGSELKIAGGSGDGMRLRVTALDGLSSSRAEILRSEGADVVRSPSGEVPRSQPLFASGALAELSGWASPPGPPLKVWIPQAEQNFSLFAAALRKAAMGAGVEWSPDPVDDNPTHVLSWRQGLWYLSGPDGEPRPLGSDVSPSEVVEELQTLSSAKFFVQLPASKDLVAQIEIGCGTANDAVEPTENPSEADYFLAGRLDEDQVEYAWVRPAVSREDQQRYPLPLRSDWYPMIPKQDEADHLSAAHQLESKVLRLAKLRAWLALESPDGNDFPYGLALKSEGGKVTTDGQLLAGTRLGLVLQLRDPDSEAVVPRYVYVFTIDSEGKSTLLFPLSARGSVENRFPIQGGPRSPPAEVTVGEHPLFFVTEPFGIDTYFLLTSEETIPNPWVLEYPGVRTRGPLGKTALGELLSITGATTRGEPPVTPTSWSLERLFFESVPGLEE